MLEEEETEFGRERESGEVVGGGGRGCGHAVGGARGEERSEVMGGRQETSAAFELSTVYYHQLPPSLLQSRQRNTRRSSYSGAIRQVDSSRHCPPAAARLGARNTLALRPISFI